jgi:hypothetical protein
MLGPTKVLYTARDAKIEIGRKIGAASLKLDYDVEKIFAETISYDRSEGRLGRPRYLFTTTEAEFWAVAARTAT